MAWIALRGLCTQARPLSFAPCMSFIPWAPWASDAQVSAGQQWQAFHTRRCRPLPPRTRRPAGPHSFFPQMDMSAPLPPALCSSPTRAEGTCTPGADSFSRNDPVDLSISAAGGRVCPGWRHLKTVASGHIFLVSCYQASLSSMASQAGLASETPGRLVRGQMARPTPRAGGRAGELYLQQAHR